MKVLPFDSHNHIQLGPSPPQNALAVLEQPPGDIGNPRSGLRGMAIMSTHPRDFDAVLSLTKDLQAPFPEDPVTIVPCFGVHPWFLHELTPADWRSTLEDDDATPPWLSTMEDLLVAHPSSIVGEIGLDGFHYDHNTRDLVSSIPDQIHAFQLQMKLAARLDRPVSVHTVKCFGALMESLSRLKKNSQLPPKIYFHAFGGKEGTVDQLLALCGRDPGIVYFGFAPVVNFRSPKTSNLVRKIGLERLLLETDHEDAARVPASVEEGIKFLAAALGVDQETVIDRTTKNAFDFYGLN